MTDKQEKILKSALVLFAKDGFKATSTSKVAKHADVSEGLIFRHFGNKEGLLDAILKEGEERARILFSNIVFETDPKAVIRKTLNIPLDMLNNPDELEFWKLQYKVKWETEQYGEHKMEPLFHALTSAFTKLGHTSPELEAKNMLLTIDGLATQFFLQKSFDAQGMIGFLSNKYEV